MKARWLHRLVDLKTLRTSTTAGKEKHRRDRARLRPRLEQLEDRLAPATFTVINTDNDGLGSLRQAILDANAQVNVAGPDRIEFNIPGSGVQTIAPTSALPTITDPVIIDGYSQPGTSPNTNTPDQGGSNAVLLIELDGSGAGDFRHQRAGHHRRRQHGPGAGDQPLHRGRHPPALGRQPRGRQLPRHQRRGRRRSRELAMACAFSTLPTTRSEARRPRTGTSSPATTTPLLPACDRRRDHRRLMPPATGNSVLGNLIGTNKAGHGKNQQSARGVHLAVVSSAAGDEQRHRRNDGQRPQRHLGQSAMETSPFITASGNTVQGNFIGTDVTGTTSLRSADGAESGVFLTGVFSGTAVLGTNDNLIGGDDDDDGVLDGVVGARNVISGNRRFRHRNRRASDRQPCPGQLHRHERGRHGRGT